MKKLTTGIFTVMLGLCATSGADAAVASQGYVDTKVRANTQSITELTQTVANNKSAAEEAIADAKKAGTDVAAALETYKTDNNAAVALKANSADVYTKSEVYTKTQADAEFMNSSEVNDAISSAVTGENGALKDYAKVTDLNATNQNVTANTNAISAINNEQTGILALAKADATSKANAAQSAAASALSAYQTTNDAAVEAAKSAADAAKATANSAVSVNESQATAISANTTAIETLNGGADVTGSVAKSIADEFTKANLSQYATTSTMNTELGKKQDNLSQTQMAAVNSGITSDKVTKYDGYDTKISQNKSAITANTTSINTINNSAVMNSGVTADVVAKANSAMQETNLKALESWTTGQCAEPTVTCSLISKGGKIAWEVVTY